MLATSTPHREVAETDYVCRRCGIIRPRSHTASQQEFCRDCITEARLLGWAPPAIRAGATRRREK